MDLPVNERVDIKKQVRKLTIPEWATLVKAFDRWPFAPEVSQKMFIFLL
jgi:transcription factor 1